MMNELYHHGVKGQKWGVRKQRDKNTTSRRNKIGVLQPVYSGLINMSDKMSPDWLIKKQVDSSAATKKDDLEKLNAYNDHKNASRIAMTEANAIRQRVKDGDIGVDYKIMERIAGSANMEKKLNRQYYNAKTKYEYNEKKVNELLEKFKDIPITQVESYRYVNFGNETISWMGKKYVRK